MRYKEPPMVNDPKLIDEIVQRVLTVTRPERIILFGSAATGAATRDSDIDILVLEAAPADTREESIRIDQALRGLALPIDIVVMPTWRFEETKQVIGGIAYPAHKYGKIIYKAA
jgi:predicted nucleotidyltransferase